MTMRNLPTPVQDVPSLTVAESPGASEELYPSDAEDGLDWPRITNALRRFKWMVAGVILAGGAGGLAATRFVKPQYLAQATIWIDEPDRGPDHGPIRAGRMFEADAWVDLLTSYAVLDQVVRDQRLFLEGSSPAARAVLEAFEVGPTYEPGSYRLTVDETGTRYVLATAQGAELETGAVGDSVGRQLGFQWAPAAGTLAPGRRIRFTLLAVRDVAHGLAEALTVRTEVKGGFLRVELQGPDPVRITAVLNAVVAGHVQTAADLKGGRLTELTRTLGDQVESARQHLQDAEASLAAFRARTITLTPDPSAEAVAGGETGGRDPVFAKFFDLQVEREQLRRDRAMLERLLTQGGDSGLTADALGVVGSVQGSPELMQALKELTAKQAELRALRYRYTNEAPAVRRLSGEIATLQRQTLPALVRGLLAELAARTDETGRRIDADAPTLRAIPRRTIEEAQLRRAVAVAGTLYTTLQQRYGEARLAETSSVPDLRVLDPAVVPHRPAKNRAPQVVLLVVLASATLAVFGAVLLDRVDPRVHYPTQVLRDLHLTILGVMPHLRLKGRPAPVRGGQLSEDVAAALEALRGISLNLVHAQGARLPLLVTVTSPEAGDGKSFLAANLAHTFAAGGHRTLLIDGDVRRGELHRRLNARRRPGLTDFLRGGTPLDAVVQATRYPAFSLIGCGTRSHDAPELLASAPMADLLTRLRADYDVILIDSAPLAAGIDSLILGMLTVNVALVLRAGYSHREMAAAKLEPLQRLPIRLLGTVLNDVPAGAGYSYYSYYLPGYEAIDEDGGRAAGGRPLVA